MTILVTGGAGYIGSHTCVELLNQGQRIVVLDNLSNSSVKSIERIEQITGKRVTFVFGDVRDSRLLDDVFNCHEIDAVIHFAGLKSVGESCSEPLRYYDNNVAGTISLLTAMSHNKCKNLLFSSSACVYGDPESVPIKEDAKLHVTNPYGETKLMVENILHRLCLADPHWVIGCLRYFNPVGAHSSGLIGEDPKGVPNNLVPYIAQVAVGKLPKLNVYGGDYPTKDGTGVRDFIHVVDLATGHVAALKTLIDTSESFTVNLGTGVGYSVLEMISAFEAASGVTIPYQVVDRRPGDIATCYSDPSKAHELLGWKAEKGIDEMCADHWRWQHNNPDGY